MPELPEVETYRRDLEKLVVGKTVDAVAVSGHRTVRRHAPDVLTDTLTGARIASTNRRGKFLVLELESKKAVVIHLRMSGQLRWLGSSDQPKLKHTHVVVGFSDDTEVHFVDPRTFGEWWVSSPDLPELWHIGPDALVSSAQDWNLAERLARRKASIKSLLLNQQIIAGLGNIYVDEVLWRSGIRADRPGADLSAKELDRLSRAISGVLAAAVEARGSTLADRQYVDIFGEPGSYQNQHHVYARAAEPCHRCAGIIERVRLGGRSSHFCPGCQH